ncbi:MAG: serine hydrolase [Bacteroidota bacterium]|nr:serine hydrolase [Bacteroidota bacterium]
MRIIRYLLAIFLLLVSIPVLSQSDIKAYLDPIIEKIIEEKKVPGLAIAIVNKDSIIFCKGYGLQRIGEPDLIDEHTLFQVASLTKPFTASLMGMLKDQGAVNWDDPVLKYIPDFKLKDKRLTELMTIRDLLSIRTGIIDGDNINASNRSEFVHLLAEQAVSPAMFRSQQTSFNTSFTLAGHILETIQGRGWEFIVKDNLLVPLGMNETYTNIKSAWEVTSNTAVPHLIRINEIIPSSWSDVSLVSPAGGIISNVTDMSKFLRMMMNEGRLDNKKIIENTSLNSMFEPQVVVGNSFKNIFNPEADLMSFGLGWFLSEYKGYKVIEMEGSLPGTSSLMAFVPEAEIGMVILTNMNFAFSSLVPLKFQILDYIISGINIAEKADGMLKEKQGSGESDIQKSIEEKNKSIVIKWLKEINKSNFEQLFDELWAKDCKQYFNSSNVAVEYDDFKEMIYNLYEEYPVISHEIHDIIARDDKVIARFSARVNHDRLMFGAPATNKELQWSAIAIFQIKDGKIQNRWEVTDLLGMYEQLGMELQSE